MVSAGQVNYLRNDDLVLGIVVDGKPRAYPHPILDWHEIVNERSGGRPFTISYCPLTGTGIAVDGTIAGQEVTFGVSGLLYNNNLIMYDRKTSSHWPQMLLQAAQGRLKGTPLPVIRDLIETSWGTWKTLFPTTQVLSDQTGFNRPYGVYPYGDYKTNHNNLLFPLTRDDKRLPRKARVHGVIDGAKTKVYPFSAFSQGTVLNDQFAGTPIVVVAYPVGNLILSYERRVDDQELTFRLATSATSFPFNLVDEQTNSTWTVLGEAITGPLSGKKLTRTLSYNAYWFAWGAFYPGALIHGQ